MDASHECHTQNYKRLWSNTNNKEKERKKTAGEENRVLERKFLILRGIAGEKTQAEKGWDKCW